MVNTLCLYTSLDYDTIILKYEINMCAFPHIQKNDHTWTAFAELAKGSVPSDRNIENYEQNTF